MYDEGFHNLFVELPNVKVPVIKLTVDWVAARLD
jgi:alpha-beta hydrolase superfamily lysophospholipase